MLKGIDVSKWNGKIDWKEVKNSGVEFAILKIINKKCEEEESFNQNYNNAKAQGIPLSVYNYSYAASVQKAIQDAKIVTEIAKGKDIKYIWLDIEDECQKNLQGKLIEIINNYKIIVEQAGFKFGVYTGLSFYGTYIKKYSNEIDCPFWIARYPSEGDMEFSKKPDNKYKPAISNKLWGWQYTSKGKIKGITNYVDLNIQY